MDLLCLIASFLFYAAVYSFTDYLKHVLALCNQQLDTNVVYRILQWTIYKTIKFWLWNKNHENCFSFNYLYSQSVLLYLLEKANKFTAMGRNFPLLTDVASIIFTVTYTLLYSLCLILSIPFYFLNCISKVRCYIRQQIKNAIFLLLYVIDTFYVLFAVAATASSIRHTCLYSLWSILNILTMLIYVWDKVCSKWRLSRISENNLLLFGVLGGWPGAIFAQQLSRHKTRKLSFQIKFVVTILVNICVVNILWMDFFRKTVEILYGKRLPIRLIEKRLFTWTKLK